VKLQIKRKGLVVAAGADWYSRLLVCQQDRNSILPMVLHSSVKKWCVLEQPGFQYYSTL